jgi:phage terminase small subunit
VGALNRGNKAGFSSRAVFADLGTRSRKTAGNSEETARRLAVIWMAEPAAAQDFRRKQASLADNLRPKQREQQKGAGRPDVC